MCMKSVSQIVSTIFVLLLLFLFKIKNIIMEYSTSSSSSLLRKKQTTVYTTVKKLGWTDDHLDQNSV